MAKKHVSSFRPKAVPFKHARTTPSIPPQSARPKPKLFPILVGGGLLYVTATYVSMLVLKSKSDTEKIVEKESGTAASAGDITPGTFDTRPIWERLSKQYDKEISWDERVMGIGLMRRWLVGQAQGDVLEVSTGTGRNFAYYKPDKISSATFSDHHPAMLREAETKFEAFKDQFHNTFVKFQEEDISNLQAKEKYDTVIDTFGLCSCKDPEAALISLADACKKSDKSRILLLEHGRSHYDWLNRLLDSNVDKHVVRWGCWWNRDLLGLFEREKVKEKIEIEKVYRWHFGTTCYIVAKLKT